MPFTILEVLSELVNFGFGGLLMGISENVKEVPVQHAGIFHGGFMLPVTKETVCKVVHNLSHGPLSPCGTFPMIEKFC